MVGGNSLLNIWLSILTNLVFDIDDRPAGNPIINHLFNGS